MDKLVINDIKLTTIIGVHAWEKQCPQTVLLDLMLQTNTASIAKTDDIADAIDYDKVVHHLLAYSEKQRFQLIETLAHHLALEILQHFNTSWVHITLRKPGALTPANVAIIIERSK